MSTRIYVGNLAYSATNEQIAQLFAEYGETSEAPAVIERDSGRSKGSAFVQLTDDAALDNRTLRVSEAQSRVDRAGGSRPRWSGGYRDTRW